MPFISETDYSDIVFGIENGFDFIAASFTRTADDILQIRKILEEHDCKSVNIIAKIENKQGVHTIFVFLISLIFLYSFPMKKCKEDNTRSALSPFYFISL